jgi:demethylmenaquinone methyltransferase/2-methoxy-6-polyprenyl-1,4-benzoquinol methylase
MSKNITPYQDSELGKKEQVAQMFDTISENYDGLNRIISFGTDAKWKKKILKMVAAKQPKSILDIATGTGDLAILFAETSAIEIIGLDISQGMLDIGKKKIEAQKLESKIKMILGDGENIPYPDNYFDVITVAYGVRNFENLEKGLAEMLRVVRPGGKLLILEFSKPKRFPIKQAFGFYSRFIIPFFGKRISKDEKAYAYLPESVAAFPEGKAFTDILSNLGYKQVDASLVSGGIATIYTGIK